MRSEKHSKKQNKSDVFLCKKISDKKQKTIVQILIASVVFFVLVSPVKAGFGDVTAEKFRGAKSFAQEAAVNTAANVQGFFVSFKNSLILAINKVGQFSSETTGAVVSGAADIFSSMGEKASFAAQGVAAGVSGVADEASARLRAIPAAAVRLGQGAGNFSAKIGEEVRDGAILAVSAASNIFSSMGEKVLDAGNVAADGISGVSAYFYAIGDQAVYSAGKAGDELAIVASNVAGGIESATREAADTAVASAERVAAFPADAGRTAVLAAGQIGTAISSGVIRAGAHIEIALLDIQETASAFGGDFVYATKSIGNGAKSIPARIYNKNETKNKKSSPTILLTKGGISSPVFKKGIRENLILLVEAFGGVSKNSFDAIIGGIDNTGKTAGQIVPVTIDSFFGIGDQMADIISYARDGMLIAGNNFTKIPANIFVKAEKAGKIEAEMASSMGENFINLGNQMAKVPSYVGGGLILVGSNVEKTPQLVFGAANFTAAVMREMPQVAVDNFTGVGRQMALVPQILSTGLQKGGNGMVQLARAVKNPQKALGEISEKHSDLAMQSVKARENIKLQSQTFSKKVFSFLNNFGNNLGNAPVRLAKNTIVTTAQSRGLFGEFGKSLASSPKRFAENSFSLGKNSGEFFSNFGEHLGGSPKQLAINSLKATEKNGEFFGRLPKILFSGANEVGKTMAIVPKAVILGANKTASSLAFKMTEKISTGAGDSVKASEVKKEGVPSGVSSFVASEIAESNSRAVNRHGAPSSRAELTTGQGITAVSEKVGQVAFLDSLKQAPQNISGGLKNAGQSAITIGEESIVSLDEIFVEAPQLILKKSWAGLLNFCSQTKNWVEEVKLAMLGRKIKTEKETVLVQVPQVDSSGKVTEKTVVVQEKTVKETIVKEIVTQSAASSVSTIMGVTTLDGGLVVNGNTILNGNKVTIAAPLFLENNFSVGKTFTFDATSGNLTIAGDLSLPEGTLAAKNITSKGTINFAGATVDFSGATVTGLATSGGTVINNYSYSSGSGRSGGGSIGGQFDALTINGDSNLKGALTVTGATALNSDVTIGDAGSDTLTINASTVSIPNNLTFSGGTVTFSSSNTSTFSNNIVVNGTGTSSFAYGATFATSGGNVGIGTSTPQFLLDVNGIINATALYVNGAAYIGSQWTTTSTDDIYYETGKVGIGTSTPLARLHIASTSTDTRGLIVQANSGQTANLLEIQNAAGDAPMAWINSLGGIGTSSTLYLSSSADSAGGSGMVPAIDFSATGTLRANPTDAFGNSAFVFDTKTSLASANNLSVRNNGSDIFTISSTTSTVASTYVVPAITTSTALGKIVMENSAWKTFTGGTAWDLLGSSVASAGDVNGDGYNDVIIGAMFASGFAGQAYIYYGGPSMDTTADVTFTGGAGAGLGTSVASAGDVNGDGYGDVIIGTATLAYIYYGGPNMNTTADVSITNGGGDSQGDGAKGVGDVNGDGYADVVVGSSGADIGGTNRGAVFLYYGGPNMDGGADVVFIGGADSETLGLTNAGAGDVNGDGYADVIAGSQHADYGGTNRGVAYIYYGGPNMDATADVTFTGLADSDRLGYAVSSAGDVNGDGFSDVIVGATYASGGAGVGAAYIYYGGSSMDATADVTFTGGASDTLFGSFVASAGDVNGDGYSDVLVDSQEADIGGTDRGAVYLYYGGSSMDTAADRIFTGEVNSDKLSDATSAGDVNGDGFNDIILGTGNAVGGDMRGQAYIYRGQSSAWSTVVTNNIFSALGMGTANARYTDEKILAEGYFSISALNWGISRTGTSTFAGLYIGGNSTSTNITATTTVINGNVSFDNNSFYLDGVHDILGFAGTSTLMAMLTDDTSVSKVFIFNANSAKSTAKLWSLQEAGSEVAYFDSSGGLYAPSSTLAGGGTTSGILSIGNGTATSTLTGTAWSLGTTAATSTLTVYNSDPWLTIGNGTASTTIGGYSVTATSTNPYGMLLATLGGNVGIGTLSPAYLLDVNGTLRTSGLFYPDRGISTSTLDNVIIGGSTPTTAFFTKSSSTQLSVFNTLYIGEAVTSTLLTGSRGSATSTFYSDMWIPYRDMMIGGAANTGNLWIGNGTSTSTFLTGTRGNATSSLYSDLYLVGRDLLVGNTADTGFIYVGDGTATSVIRGGTPGSVTSTFEGDVSISYLFAGATEFDQDAGIVQAMTIPVSSSATTGTVEGYTFDVDSLTVLTIGAVSEAQGVVWNNFVGVGTSTPAWSNTQGQYTSLNVAGMISVGIAGSNLGGTSTFYGNLAATGTITSNCVGTCLDIAETYESINEVESGDVVVALDGTEGGEAINPYNTSIVKKSITGYSGAVVGVVSTNPGIVLTDDSFITMGGGGSGSAKKPNVALAGRVPVKVTNENGEIKKGDLLVTSPTEPGYAMKLGVNPPKGIISVLGMALENWDDATAVESTATSTVKLNKVLVMIKSGYVYNLESKAEALDNQLTISEEGTDIAASEDYFDMEGKSLINVKSLASASGSWSLSEDGVFVAKSVKAKVVSLGELIVAGDAETDGSGNKLDSAIGNTYIKSDESVKVVYNNRVKKNSQIFITFRDNTGGPWWISNQGDGFFEVSVQASMGYNIRFGYWVVGVEGGDDTVPAKATIQTDSLPPEISGAAAVNVTDISATINWTTNEDADSTVIFNDSVASSTAEQTIANGDLVSSHSINITGLEANTTYNYIVKSTDVAGNVAESASYSFATASDVGTPEGVPTSTSPSEEEPPATVPPVDTDQTTLTTSTPSEEPPAELPIIPILSEDTTTTSTPSNN